MTASSGGSSIVFRVPNGVEVELSIEGADVAGGHVVLQAIAEPKAWYLIENGFLFNLDRASLEGGMFPQLGDDATVRVTLRLDDGLAGDLAKKKGSAIVKAVADAPPSDPLRDTERWFLARAEVLSGGNGEASGFTTVFDDADALETDAPAIATRVSVEDLDDSEQPGPLLQLALSFLEDAEIDVDVLGGTVAGGRYESDEGPIDLIVHSREQVHHLLAYARMPDAVPEDRRAQVMELVTRINPDLPTAWLELDLDEGRVSARTALNARGITVRDDTYAENIITVALSTMEQFLPAIRAVAFEGVDVADIPDPGED